MPSHLSGAAGALQRKCASCASTYEEAVAAAGDEFGKCLALCAQQLSDDLRQCAGLTGDEREACLTAAMQRYQDCVRRCADVRDAELRIADATFTRDVLRATPM